MTAQRRTLKLLRLTGIVGVITGIAMGIADISLLYSPAGGYESDAALLGIPMWRLLLGHYLGVLMLPFYLVAVWHLYEGIKPGGTWLAIPVAALLGYVAAAGGAFHGSIAGLALIVQAGVGASPETQTVLTHLLANAHQFVEPFRQSSSWRDSWAVCGLARRFSAGTRRIRAGSCSPTRCLSMRLYSLPTFSPPTRSARCCCLPHPV